ncbi:MAG: PEP-CTERM sorting domain-containing protein [Acidobacteriia bacterium]|nr:PEP-CTERM sorting domain-containing protein [Terriglobia bacterium]
MRRFVVTVALMLLVFLMIKGSAAADTIYPWVDNTNHWPGYGNSNENSTDTIGEPNITGGTVVVSGTGFLKSISYDFITPPGWSFSKMKPGDLFLDTNNDQTWDYVLSLGYDSAHQYVPTGVVTLYQINFSAAGYLITGSDNTGYWSGYGIRNNHPYAYVDFSNAVNLGSGSVSGGISALPTSPFTYSLPINAISVSGPLTFGFTENCANDVVKETVTTAPEPGTMLLLGTGLIGAAIFGRKRLKK